MTIDPHDAGTDLLYSLEQDVDVIDIRNVLQRHCLIGHNGSRDDRQSRVFRAADIDLAHKRDAALDNVLFHRTSVVSPNLSAQPLKRIYHNPIA